MRFPSRLIQAFPRGLVAAAAVALLVTLGVSAGPAGAEATANTYKTTIELSDAKPGAAVRVISRIVAVGDTYEKLDTVESDLAAGMELNEKAFAARCVLSGKGSESGSVCPEKFAAAKVGSAVMTTSMFGKHTVRADAYMVDSKSAPDGENIALYFPGGQVFGVGEQTVLGHLSLGSATERKLVMKNIGDQLSLPFGMQARVIGNEFTFEGQGGELPYKNPAEGSIESWQFETKLGWSGGGQTTKYHATVAEPSAAP